MMIQKIDAPTAILSDIHGNALALEAVLKDAAERGIHHFMNLGDIFYGPLDPGATWRILQSHPMPTILGNQDRVLLEADGPDTTDQIHANRESLGEEGLQWLESLPKTVTLDNAFLCHGTPIDDAAYLLEDVSSGSPRRRPCNDMAKDLQDVPSECSLILTGHSHFPGQAQCPGRTIVNPGSVGLPAYDDDTPPHAMAAGSPHARYCIVTPAEEDWQVKWVDVIYDWDTAAEQARTNGREDWARWLTTGTAQPL